MKNIIRVGLALGLVAGSAVAQNPPAAQPKAAAPKAQQPGQPGAPGQMGPMGQMGQMGQMGPMGQMGGRMRAQPNRAQLEQQVRDRIGTQLKKSLNLNDDQFSKLQATNKRFEERRRLLVEQERDARMSMRDLMISGDTTNQGKVSAALDKMLQIQRQRFELVEQEQKELAGYLVPMQRARFLGMQEQLFRRVEAMRAQGAGRRGQPGGQGMRPGMGRGMGEGMGQGMGPGMGQPGMGQPGMGQPGMRNQRPMQGMRRPPNGPPGGQAPVVPPVDDIVR